MLRIRRYPPMCLSTSHWRQCGYLRLCLSTPRSGR